MTRFWRKRKLVLIKRRQLKFLGYIRMEGLENLIQDRKAVCNIADKLGQIDGRTGFVRNNQKTNLMRDRKMWRDMIAYALKRHNTKEGCAKIYA